MIMRKSFTLLELLVVIAIIMILIAIGLASLLKSKGTAQATACKSLLKQYQIATECYCGDWDDFYPDARKHLDATSGLLCYFSKGRTVWPQDYSRCPGDQKTEELGRLGEFTAYDNCKVSIGTSENALSDSERMTRFGAVAFWRKRSQFKLSASDIFTWADWQNNPYDPAPTAAMVKPTTSSLGSLCFRHNGSSNAAYRDGHVGDMRLVHVKTIDNGHDFDAGSDWTVTESIGKYYKMYYPFGPPPENTTETTEEKKWPDIDYK
jgi:prepilin-type processing-associated H-X9-DG protein